MKEGKNLVLIDRCFLLDPALPDLTPGPMVQCCWSDHLLGMEGRVPGSPPSLKSYLKLLSPFLAHQIL